MLEKNTPDLLIPNWDAPAHIHAFTTLRTYPLENLNTLLPIKPIRLHQIHSNIAVEAIPTNEKPSADAIFTTEINQPCMVATADCLPILICNLAGNKIAAIHAGWRGLSSGIIENTLHALNSTHDEWLAWLGPAIGPKQFEVGEDVFTAFTAQDEEAKMAFQALHEQKWLANLYLLAKLRLQRLGVTKIYGGNYCTYEQFDMFHSYRREKSQRDRLLSVIWRT